MKRIKKYVWQRFIGYNSDMTAQIWCCRVLYHDGMLVEEIRPMPQEDYNDIS